MFNRSKKAHGGLTAWQINIGTLLGEEKDEDAFIVLTELPIGLSMGLRNLAQKKNAETAMVKFFAEALPVVLVDHNLHETETELMKNEDVIELLKGKTDIFLHVMSEYTSHLFPTPPSKSEKR